MKKLCALLAALLVSLSAWKVEADILVLIHGYLGSAHSWEAGGVTTVLEANRWHRAGIVTPAPHGVHLLPAPGHVQAENKVYLVELPSAAPIVIQADHLQAMVWFLNAQHPDERIILAGHSVGGVVARLALVRRQIPNAAALITIASPHLGTPRAEQALDATDGSFPFGMMRDFFGGSGYQTLKYSRGLYIDIIQPYPGSFLHWLNLQPHPAIGYHAIARGGPFILSGDILVPGYSQDMNRVPALAGRSTLFTIGTGHFLTPADGQLLVEILNKPRPGPGRETK